MDRSLRNELRNTVTRCRRLLEETIADDLEGRLGVSREGGVREAGEMGRLSSANHEHRERAVSHLRHIEAGGFEVGDAVGQLVREVSYTHLNRLCAYKMLERRRLIRESVGRKMKSNGFMHYLADHPDDERLWSSGRQDAAYRNFLAWLGETLSTEIGALFSPDDPANRLFPPQRTLDAVLDLLNDEKLEGVWDSEETVGWVYQYYTPKELRDEARKESQAPRNSYELSFRNQFYTPNYVVRFLVDNSLGRTWHEMRHGKTRLAERCEYLVRHPDEVFLSEAASEGSDSTSDRCAEIAKMAKRLRDGKPEMPQFEPGEERISTLAKCADGTSRHGGDSPDNRKRASDTWHSMQKSVSLSLSLSLSEFSTQEILDVLSCMGRREGCGGEEGISGRFAAVLANEVRRRVFRPDGSDAPSFVAHRAPKDPRDLRILDPACGSGHFLLYCFDLLEVIYEEAYDDESLGAGLREEYPERDGYLASVPGMILRHNLHGIDIDVRATQIAALALWLRAQRSYEERGVKKNERPAVARSNVVCAEPMPGGRGMLEEFTDDLDPPLLRQLVEVVFDGMKLAGEAGSLLKIEETIASSVGKAHLQWQREFAQATDLHGEGLLLTEAEMDRLSDRASRQANLFDVSGIDGEEFWKLAEGRVLEELRKYAAASSGDEYRRRLFADDAERGFAFVDMCRSRFDVVLMNPPFGEASKPSKSYIGKNYPRTKNDVYAAFVERGLGWLRPGGMLGAITSRTGFFLSSFRKWREEIVLEEARPTVVADLGQGVLDTAMVETAAYVLQKSGGAKSV